MSQVDLSSPSCRIPLDDAVLSADCETFRQQLQQLVALCRPLLDGQLPPEATIDALGIVQDEVTGGYDLVCYYTLGVPTV